MNRRQRGLLEAARRRGYDTLVACTPENLFYMTGFWGEAVGVLDQNGATIVSPALEAQRAAAESDHSTVVSAERGSQMVPRVADAISGESPCTDCQDYSTMVSLQKYVKTIKHTPEPFTDMRIIKDADEIRTLQKASRIIDGLFETCAQTMVPDQTESELQAVLMSQAMEQDMFDTGYHSTLNPLIIAGGPNGALPHAQVTTRRFQRGDMIVVDITLRHKAYVSDATRTFAVGAISQEAEEIYGVVRDSQELGIRAAVPDAPAHTVDKACRDSIVAAGYGDYFIHATGHGIGLEVHENPTVAKSGDTILKQDMAITVEPGIYMPQSLGVRIEDSMMVGGPVMHRFTKELVRV